MDLGDFTTSIADSYTITLDSTQSTSNTEFQVVFTKILKNVTKVEILRASVSSSNIQDSLYLHIDELICTMNDRIYDQTTSISSLQGAVTPTVARSALLSESILSWNPEQTPRETFTPGKYWRALSYYKVPITSLDRLTIKIVDKYGQILDNIGTDYTYITLRVWCKPMTSAESDFISNPVVTQIQSSPSTTTYKEEPKPWYMSKWTYITGIIVSFILILALRR